MSNKISAVQCLFDECSKHNPDLNKIDEYINECRSKDEDMNAFIHNGHKDFSTLQIVCCRGHHEIVERLLDSQNNFINSVDVNKASDLNYNKTALYYACTRYCTLTVRALLQHPNIDVNKADDLVGSTPLHCACNGDRKEIVIEILKHPGIQLPLKDKSGLIPLHIACIHIMKDTDIIQMLIGHQQQKYRIEQLNATDNNHQSPLYVACLNSNCNAVLEILKHEADIDINVSDVDGQTPLHAITLSRFYYRDSMTVNIIKNLLEQQSIMIYKNNNNGKTPLDIFKERLKVERFTYQYLTEIIQLFDEYHVRQRWLAYCYLITCDFIVKEQPRNMKNCDTRRRL